MKENLPHKGEGHRKRLRDKFLESGLSGFQDYEVIELLLTLGTPRRDCKEMAKEAINRFGSLQGVFEATANELMDIQGIGAVNLFGVKLIKEVAERYLEKKLTGKELLSNSRDLTDYLNLIIRDKRHECFVVIYLNAKNRVLASETLFRGSLTSSAVYPREVIQAALDHRAAALIFAHNHPSGEAEPSPEDIAITKRLLYACRMMGITVHEHIIIAENGNFSFADGGYILQFNREFEQQTINE